MWIYSCVSAVVRPEQHGEVVLLSYTAQRPSYDPIATEFGDCRCLTDLHGLHHLDIVVISRRGLANEVRDVLGRAYSYLRLSAGPAQKSSRSDVNDGTGLLNVR